MRWRLHSYQSLAGNQFAVTVLQPCSLSSIPCEAGQVPIDLPVSACTVPPTFPWFAGAGAPRVSVPVPSFCLTLATPANYWTWCGYGRFNPAGSSSGRSLLWSWLRRWVAVPHSLTLSTWLFLPNPFSFPLFFLTYLSCTSVWRLPVYFCSVLSFLFTSVTSINLVRF